MQFDQAMLDTQDKCNGSRPQRKVTDVVVDKGQCVAATNAAGFICDFRTGFPNVCPSGGQAAQSSPVDSTSTDASPDDAIRGMAQTPAAPSQPAACSTDLVFGEWRSLRLFQADGQWQISAAE
jgi:hypothetical protein